jgi:hypothetical protein
VSRFLLLDCAATAFRTGQRLPALPDMDLNCDRPIGSEEWPVGPVFYFLIFPYHEFFEEMILT